jgi:hypothetical protein
MNFRGSRRTYRDVGTRQHIPADTSLAPRQPPHSPALCPSPQTQDIRPFPPPTPILYTIPQSHPAPQPGRRQPPCPKARPMRRRRLPILMLALTLALLATVSALADPPDPAVYLTANLTAVATSPAVTAMEQALLDRIAGAATSIDAAIYDFERGINCTPPAA